MQMHLPFGCLLKYSNYGQRFPFGPGLVLFLSSECKTSFSVGTYRADFLAADVSFNANGLPLSVTASVRWPPALRLWLFKCGFQVWLGFVGFGYGYVVLGKTDSTQKTYLDLEWPKWRLGYCKQR
jgi:hypothetical protein